MHRSSVRGGIGLLVAALLSAAVPRPAAADNLFGERWNLSGESTAEPLQPVPHRPVYIQPLSYNENAASDVWLPGQGRSGLERMEFAYQVSVKALLAPDLLGGRGDLWFGYTQKAWWQAYTSGESEPIRETNYEPELIYAHRPASEVFGVEPDLLSVRLNHISDGRGRVRSRGFNRLGAGLLFDDGEQAFRYRAWYPLPASSSVDGDTIADYFGRVQFDWFRTAGPATWHVMLRNNLRFDDNRTTLSVSYTFPTASQHLHGMVEYHHGYGDGLVDYDHHSNRLSIGAMFIRWH